LRAVAVAQGDEPPEGAVMELVGSFIQGMASTGDHA
jgi:hypothetical protein